MGMDLELAPQCDGTAPSSVFLQVILVYYLAFNAIIQVVDTVVLGCVYTWIQHLHTPQTPTRCTCMLIGVVVSVAVTAATLLTGIVYLQLDTLMFPGRVWVFPVTLWLTVPSIPTPLY